jgi:hypothetical protein
MLFLLQKIILNEIFKLNLMNYRTWYLPIININYDIALFRNAAMKYNFFKRCALL